MTSSTEKSSSMIPSAIFPEGIFVALGFARAQHIIEYQRRFKALMDEIIEFGTFNRFVIPISLSLQVMRRVRPSP